MKSTRPAPELFRADKPRGADAAELNAAETAWPVAMANLAQAIGEANQDLADKGIEAQFINEPLACGSAISGTEIVLQQNGETATASITLGSNGNVDVSFKHSSRHEHKHLQIAAGSVDAWADVLHQLYKIATPPKTYL